VDLFGTPASIGFYNTFTARVPAGHTRAGETEIAADAETGDVYALRGSGYASVQGHLESILSRDGMTTLEGLVTHALTPVGA
jgi:phenazine biosynthesis protein phzE